MTMPESLQSSLPGQVVGQQESPMVARIGVVTDIVESDNITVRISGSPVLVTASYLFPQYQPLLGDRVYVTKQDAQWFVLGTMSGPINSVVPNASFEDGVLGATPSNWTLVVTSAAAGVPTFTKVSADQDGMTGSFMADFGVDSNPIGGLSEAEAYSTAVPASPNSRWTGAYYLTKAFIDGDSVTLESNGQISFLDMYIQFLDAGGALVSETAINTLSMNVDNYGRLYRRPNVTAPFVTAPPGTAQVRVRMSADFFMSPSSFTSFFIDYIVLREL